MNEDNKNWLTKHIDTLIVLGVLGSGFLWFNGKFNAIDKDLAVIKTVLILKGILPESLVKETLEDK